LISWNSLSNLILSFWCSTVFLLIPIVRPPIYSEFGWFHKWCFFQVYVWQGGISLLSPIFSLGFFRRDGCIITTIGNSDILKCRFVSLISQTEINLDSSVMLKCVRQEGRYYNKWDEFSDNALVFFIWVSLSFLSITNLIAFLWARSSCWMTIWIWMKRNREYWEFVYDCEEIASPEIVNKVCQSNNFCW
jgi:hypothetical protein